MQQRGFFFSFFSCGAVMQSWPELQLVLGRLSFYHSEALACRYALEGDILMLLQELLFQILLFCCIST